jgi:hypothetical protein
MRYCDNCGEFLRHKRQRFCQRRCKDEYWRLNVALLPTPLNILQVLIEERHGGPMAIELNASVWGLSQYMRIAPLIIIREAMQRHAVIEITAAGRTWYDFHTTNR